MDAPDVIVIGAGGGGPVVARGLAANGVDVRMLEAGPWYRDLDAEFTKLEDEMFSVVQRATKRHLHSGRAGHGTLRGHPRRVRDRHPARARPGGRRTGPRSPLARRRDGSGSRGRRARDRSGRWLGGVPAFVAELPPSRLQWRRWAVPDVPRAGFFDREVHPDVGQVTMARADFPGQGTLFVQGNGVQNVAIALATGGRGFWDEAPTGEPWDLEGRFWGEEAVRRMRNYSRTLSVLVCTDDEDPDNRVTLADDWPADEHGAVPKVIYRKTPRTKERQDWLARKAAEILRAAGAHAIHRTNFGRAVLTHLMGTMRMGRDPARSVVDAESQAHEVEGLFLGDSSILTNGLGGPNPTLTAQALAARPADRILATGLA